MFDAIHLIAPVKQVAQNHVTLLAVYLCDLSRTDHIAILERLNAPKNDLSLSELLNH